MKNKKRPNRYFYICRRCGFRGTRGVRADVAHEGEVWNIGLCKHREACKRRQTHNT